MIGQHQFAAILGFAFVALWVVASFGQAILCLVGALAFAALSAYRSGELDLAEINDRLQSDARRGDTGSAPRARQASQL